MRVYKKDGLIAKGKTIGMHRMSGGRHQVIHRHEFIELVYIADGKAVESIDGKEYEVERGDMLFIDLGSTHNFTTHEGFTHVEIFFSPALLEGGAVTPQNALSLLSLSLFKEMRGEEGGGKVTFTGEDLREVEFILAAMQREYESERSDASSLMESYLNILLTKMRRKSEEASGDKDVWEKLKAYIDAHFEEELSLSTLAGKSFYNPSYFSRTFKKKFGASPTEYIRARRMEHAKLLLVTEDSSVEDILHRVGFSDRSAFYHAFSAATGMTPAEYRAKHIKK